MNTTILFATAAILALTNIGFSSPIPEALLLKSEGGVAIDGKPAKKGATMKVGQEISTQHDGMALLTLAAGQILTVEKDTKATLTTLTYSADGKDRSSSVTVSSGSVSSDLHHSEKGTTSHTVITPFAQLKATGTAWNTKLTSDGFVLMEFAGTVTGVIPGIGTVKISQGCVATLSGAPTAPVLRVVDLTTGKVQIYRPGLPVEEAKATKAELSLASSSFQTGVTAASPTFSAGDKAAVAQVAQAANQVLAANQIAGMQFAAATPGSQSAPGAAAAGNGGQLGALGNNRPGPPVSRINP